MNGGISTSNTKVEWLTTKADRRRLGVGEVKAAA
jgi:hypothetical protein